MQKQKKKKLSVRKKEQFAIVEQHKNPVIGKRNYTMFLNRKMSGYSRRINI
jgi:hypothetical protein